MSILCRYDWARQIADNLREYIDASPQKEETIAMVKNMKSAIDELLRIENLIAEGVCISPLETTSTLGEIKYHRQKLDEQVGLLDTLLKQHKKEIIKLEKFFEEVSLIRNGIREAVMLRRSVARLNTQIDRRTRRLEQAIK